MRYALAALLALGCSDPTPDAPSALRGTCGDAGPGMQWINAEGCTSTCSLVDGSAVNITCRPDSGAAFCSPLTDIHNCHECFHDCPTTDCRPRGGLTFTSSCGLNGCVCTPQ